MPLEIYKCPLLIVFRFSLEQKKKKNQGLLNSSYDAVNVKAFCRFAAINACPYANTVHTHLRHSNHTAELAFVSTCALCLL